MARRRIVWRYLVLVVPILVLLPYFFIGALLIGLSSPALNPESFVSTDGRVVSVGPGEVINADAIEEARRRGAVEGLSDSEVDVPDLSYGACTVVFTYVVASTTLTSTERSPRQDSWCDRVPGEVVAVAYDPADPSVVTDDYNAVWNAMYRTYRIVLVVLVATSLTGLVLVVRAHVHNRRVRGAEGMAAAVRERDGGGVTPG